MLPSMEAVVGTYLNSLPEIAALGAQAVGTTPRETDQPWVLVTSMNPQSLTVDADDHFVNHMIQLDCYAGRNNNESAAQQDEADRLTRTVREALKNMRTATLPVVVSTVSFPSCPRLPDSDFEPARQRYSLTAEVYAHA